MNIMATPKAYLPAAILAGILAFSAPASAAWRTTEVRINDLDLASSAGQATLETRLERAIKNVCRSNSSKALSERKDIAKCEANARATAEAEAEKRVAAYKVKNERMASAE
jgi:UrcA family protein